MHSRRIWKCTFSSTCGLGTHRAPPSIVEHECFPKSTGDWIMKLRTRLILRLRVSRTFIFLLPGSSWWSVIHSDFISFCVMHRNLKYQSQKAGLTTWNRIFLEMTTVAQPDTIPARHWSTLNQITLVHTLKPHIPIWAILTATGHLA